LPTGTLLLANPKKGLARSREGGEERRERRRGSREGAKGAKGEKREEREEGAHAKARRGRRKKRRKKGLARRDEERLLVVVFPEHCINLSYSVVLSSPPFFSFLFLLPSLRGFARALSFLSSPP